MGLFSRFVSAVRDFRESVRESVREIFSPSPAPAEAPSPSPAPAEAPSPTPTVHESGRSVVDDYPAPAPIDSAPQRGATIDDYADDAWGDVDGGPLSSETLNPAEQWLRADGRFTPETIERLEKVLMERAREFTGEDDPNYWEWDDLFDYWEAYCDGWKQSV